MPGVILTNASGGQNIVSGNFWSGQGAQRPVGGVQVVPGPANSGNIWIAASGGVTVNSGTAMDGIPVKPGQAWFFPRSILFGQGSGAPQIWIAVDPNTSGFNSVFFEGI
jgi:hypothetical protein